MVIVNMTRYQTRDLRKFAVRAAREIFPNDARRRNGLTVTFKTTARRVWLGGVRGHATLHGTRSVITLPSPRRSPVSKTDLAWTLVHEFAHNKGESHQAMRDRWYWHQKAGWERHVHWADELPLRLVPPKQKPSVEQKREARLDHAKALLAKWTRAQKLAATKVKKYRAAVKRHEKALSIPARPPSEPGDRCTILCMLPDGHDGPCSTQEQEV